MRAWSVPFLFVAVVSVLVALTVSAEPYEAKVVEVISGDALRVERDGKVETVRLLSIDCPELGQPFGPEAKALTVSLVQGKTVTVETPLVVKPEAEPAESSLETPPPPEGGPVAVVVMLEDDTVLNRELLAAGLAWLYEPDGTVDRTLRGLVATAIKEKKGLWSDPAPLAPWDFRGDAGKNQTDVLDEIGEKEPEEQTLALKGEGELQPRKLFPQFESNPIYQQAQPRWHKNDKGEVLGLTAQNIEGIPFAAMLGFKNGDVLQSVNGAPIRSEADVMGLIERHKNASSVNVGIIRNGQPQTISVAIPKF